MEPTLTPGSPLLRAAETALQWGHSMEELSGTPLDQVQRTARVAAWLFAHGTNPLVVATPSADHAVAMREHMLKWMDRGVCWIASPPSGTPAFPESMVVAMLQETDLPRAETLPEGTQPHVILTATGILRVVLNHPVLGPR